MNMARRTHTIRVYCRRGQFEYEYNGGPRLPFSTVRVGWNDRIVLECEDSECWLAIHIGYNSPTPCCSYQAKPGGAIVVDIPPAAVAGVYKYTVAVFDGSDIWTDDPDFIVRG